MSDNTAFAPSRVDGVAGHSVLAALRPVLATALDAVIVLTADGVVADWNTGAVITFGWDRDEALGRPLTDLIVPPEMVGAHDSGMRRFAETGEGPVLRRRIEVMALHRSGRRLPVELMVTPVGEGEDQVFLGFLRDISERLRAETALKRQARVSALMFEIAALAGSTDSFEEAVTAALRAICDLSGWPCGHALVVADGGRELVSSGIWHPADPDSFAGLKAATAAMRFPSGFGLPGRILERGEPVWIGDARRDPEFHRSRMAQDVGVEAAFGFPVKTGTALILVLEFFSAQPAEPDADLMLTVATVGEQIGRVFERKRLEDRLRAEKAALEAEVAERKRIEQRQALLLAELNHRVKNTLTVVMGIASQTARSSLTMRAFTDDFLGRLASLGRTHSLLTARDWGETALDDLAGDVIGPHLAPGDPRVRIAGPRVMLGHKAALSMSMVLHELTTNAVKYGALGRAAGALTVEWRVVGAGELELRWREHGVRIEGQPATSGFGSKMIRACVGHELHGAAQAHWHPDGLEYVVRFPLSGADPE